MSIEVDHDGDRWHIWSIGVRQNGLAYCHLASTTRFRQQRNGPVPVQMADWIPEATIEAAPGGTPPGPFIVNAKPSATPNACVAR